VPLLVETRFGRVRGRLDRGVTVFRGLPYAAPPIGPLRFKAPARLEPWSGVRDAREPGPAAPQNEPRLALLGPRPALEQSEDCLRLDLSTAGFDGVPRPVLVFVHGGGWTIGDLDTHDEPCRLLCRQSGCTPLSPKRRSV